MFLVDSHCHLDMLEENGNDLSQLLLRAKEQDVKYLLNVCVSLADFPRVLAIAEQHDFISASLGVHPNEQENVSYETLIDLGKHPKVIAIGETGLDYFRSTGDLTWQRDRFREHIHAAKTLQKPLIVHTREAQDDTMQILKEEHAQDASGVMHCFTENWEVAKKALDLGFYISFSGIVTFKNATTIQEVASKLPLESMLIETDSPYLAPIPHRGKPNEPAYIRHTAEFIAALRGISLAELAEKTTDNFFTLFKKAARPHV